MSLDSLVSVGLNPEIYENQTQPQVAIESTEAAAHRTHIISHDTTLERLLGDSGTKSGATPMECHELGEVLFHTVPTSVRKGTHKLLLNHPKFHVEFRINRQFKGQPKTVWLWVKIAPKGVLDRSVIIDANNPPPTMQCNHCDGKVLLCSPPGPDPQACRSRQVWMGPPHRIPTNEGVQPIHVKGKVSGAVVPSDATLAHAQFQVNELSWTSGLM